MHYAVVIERAGDRYSAYVPDLPGCVATGATIADVMQTIAGAIRFHIDGSRADRAPSPEADDPFVTFTEWAGAADEAAYANL